MSDCPPTCRPHLRVPEEQFNVQTRMYGRYHVTTPQQFFRSDDLWTVPEARRPSRRLPTEAYYVVMRMPGEPEAEFLLLQPMIPRNRPNMIAWVAARMDARTTATTRVYRFPTDTTVFGPAQIEARIDADPLISAQITLWNQAGSTVIRGNLIVVPVGDSLIYLQPVYLQSTGSALPEFQRIVVASPREVVWARRSARPCAAARRGGTARRDAATVARAVARRRPDRGARRPSRRPGPGPAGPAGDVEALIEYANLHFELAQAALRDGDFATYGEEIELVGAALQELTALGPARRHELGSGASRRRSSWSCPRPAT